MGKLLYTKKIPFSLEDWKNKTIIKLAAGSGCVMAVTKEGEVLQGITDEDKAAATKFWKNIKDVAVSKVYCGMAIGLVKDGTCMISKKPLRTYIEGNGLSQWHFERVNNAVKSWKDIVQVACSDAFFALDAGGKVHCAEYDNSDDYYAANNWKGIARIVPGNQNSLFGITYQGNVLCSGGNLSGSYRANMRTKLLNLECVVDIWALGSECEKILYATKEGCVYNLEGELIAEGCARKAPVFDGNFVICGIRMADGSMKLHMYNQQKDLQIVEKWEEITGFAIGDSGYGNAFVIGTCSRTTLWNKLFG